MNGVWLLRADDTIDLSRESRSLLQQEILIQLREINKSIQHICHKINLYRSENSTVTHWTCAVECLSVPDLLTNNRMYIVHSVGPRLME